MKIIAIAAKGAEFFYRSSAAHKVSAAAAEQIKDALNAANYQIKPGEVWHIFDVDSYTSAYAYAERQAFKRRKGRIYRATC